MFPPPVGALPPPPVRCAPCAPPAPSKEWAELSFNPFAIAELASDSDSAESSDPPLAASATAAALLTAPCPSPRFADRPPPFRPHAPVRPPPPSLNPRAAPAPARLSFAPAPPPAGPAPPGFALAPRPRAVPPPPSRRPLPPDLARPPGSLAPPPAGVALAPFMPPPRAAPRAPAAVSEAERAALRELALLSDDALEQRARQGLDPAVRGCAWPAILGLNWEVEQRTLTPLDAIAAMGRPPSRAMIEQDIAHTLRDTAGRACDAPSLAKILVAYANLDPELGYVRGMAYFAAVLLSCVDEARAFWSFVRLMAGTRFQFRRIFVNRFEGLSAINVVWQGLLADRYRKVAERLTKNEILPQMYTTLWFVTAFAGVKIDAELKMRIFDRFVVCGCRALLSFGLVIIARLQDALVKAGSAEALLLLQNLEKAEQLKDVKALLVTYDKVWVSESVYLELFRKVGIQAFK
jgi:hypothetical protein